MKRADGHDPRLLNISPATDEKAATELRVNAMADTIVVTYIWPCGHLVTTSRFRSY